ncbi:imm11 family protein [Stratiformator vulcanicus]|nr:DUF1629 domain-containing protein [Stratiformator vulcanicus]
MLPGDDQWVLSISRAFDDGTPVDRWAFIRCKKYEGAIPIPFDVASCGPATDYNPTAFGAQIVSAKFAAIVRDVAKDSVQFVPASVHGSDNDWFVMNELESRNCVDLTHSWVQRYEEGDGDRAGTIRGIAKLVIDPPRADNLHMLRLREYKMVTIISETLQSRLESKEVTGIEYWQLATQ